MQAVRGAPPIGESADQLSEDQLDEDQLSEVAPNKRSFAATSGNDKKASAAVTASQQREPPAKHDKKHFFISGKLLLCKRCLFEPKTLFYAKLSPSRLAD